MMIEQSPTRPPVFGWCRTFNLFVLLALLVMFAPLAPASQAAPHAQLALLTIAAEHPNARVSVIVQKLARDAAMEQLVTKLGGVVTADLHIINAFAADMPARVALQLGRATGVRWVSLDTAVVRTTACTPCVPSGKIQAHP